MSGPAALYRDESDRWGLVEADALALLPRLPDHAVDAVVTDPPYGIAFHGEAWDGRRTGDGVRMATGQRFADWTRQWATDCRRVLKPGGHLVAFGSPRTFHRLMVGIEDAGFEIRDLLIWLNGQGLPKSRRLPGDQGTMLRPGYEPIVLARAPLTGQLADNRARHRTGTLNLGHGRWPGNVVVSHEDTCTDARCGERCPVALLDRLHPDVRPSRFFYCAKAAAAEREAGCEGLRARSLQLYTDHHHPPRRVRNVHPTVKPLALMRWLVQLAVPPGGLVLDPFAGSGSTGGAAVLEGRQFLGVEREADYVDIACAQIRHWTLRATDAQAA